MSHRVLLAGAAGFLAVGIWTMHFIGMLAAPIPADTVYLILPTIISFLICALVVGISLFFVSIGEPSLRRVVSSAILLGVGIASMHYVGMHGLSGNFVMEHDNSMVLLSVLVAIVAAYGGLRAFLARQDGIRPDREFDRVRGRGVGMHYTAMFGGHFVPLSGEGHHHVGSGLAASQQILSIVVAVLCFVIAAGFLLSLVPEPRRRGTRDAIGETGALAPGTDTAAADVMSVRRDHAGPGGPAGRFSAAGRTRPAPAPCACRKITARGRQRYALHRHRQCPQCPGRRTLYKGA